MDDETYDETYDDDMSEMNATTTAILQEMNIDRTFGALLLGSFFSVM